MNVAVSTEAESRWKIKREIDVFTRDTYLIKFSKRKELLKKSINGFWNIVEDAHIIDAHIQENVQSWRKST